MANFCVGDRVVAVDPRRIIKAGETGTEESEFDVSHEELELLLGF